MIIEKNNIPLVLWYDEEAPTLSTENNPIGTTFGSYTADDSWEEWSLPIGNGYFGANVFGRTETERIQISEKTLTNPSCQNTSYEMPGSIPWESRRQSGGLGTKTPRR